MAPNQNLIRELEYFGDELYVVGGVITPRSLYSAIHEGFKTGAGI